MAQMTISYYVCSQSYINLFIFVLVCAFGRVFGTSLGHYSWHLMSINAKPSYKQFQCVLASRRAASEIKLIRFKFDEICTIKCNVAAFNSNGFGYIILTI